MVHCHILNILGHRFYRLKETRTWKNLGDSFFTATQKSIPLSGIAFFFCCKIVRSKHMCCILQIPSFSWSILSLHVHSLESNSTRKFRQLFVKKKKRLFNSSAGILVNNLRLKWLPELSKFPMTSSCHHIPALPTFSESKAWDFYPVECQNLQRSDYFRRFPKTLNRGCSKEFQSSEV